MFVNLNTPTPNNTNNNTNNEPKNEKNNDLKGIALISIGIMTIIAAIAGASYAWFAVSVSGTIGGESAFVGTDLQGTGTLLMDITEPSGVGTKKLIPQLDTAIQKAVTGTSSKSCIDANGNAICKVYQIKLTNKSTAKYYVDGTITFSGNGKKTTALSTSSTNIQETMPNLKWALGTSATAGFPSSTGPFYAPGTAHVVKTNTTASYSTIITNQALSGTGATGDVKYFYIVVWISEIGEAQADNGTFTATISFVGHNGAGTEGISSTITG